MNGTHIVADLYGCKNHEMMTNLELLKGACVKVIQDAKLTIVGEAWHVFPSMDGKGAGGITGTLLLAESHLAIHTWPEKETVTLDIYTCNVSRNNSDVTMDAVDELILVLESESSGYQIIDRGCV